MFKLLKNLDQFFAEASGQLSNVRLNATLCVCVALFLAIDAQSRGVAIDSATIVILLGAGFGSKVFQKTLENKNANGKNSPPGSSIG